MPRRIVPGFGPKLLSLACLAATGQASLPAAEPVGKAFFVKHCTECHSADSPEGGLDLTALTLPGEENAKHLDRWIKIHDRLTAGTMPPRDRPRPAAAEINSLSADLKREILSAEQAKQNGESRTGLRRLTRAEYENTLRDLFDLPGIALQEGLPTDGSAHGFDKNDEALDLSHVNLAKYVEAADLVLDMAIATRPEPPPRTVQRISLAKHVGHILGNGDAVLLKNMQPDPDFPPAGVQSHIDQGAHERMGSFDRGSTVGIFRHEDESFHPYYQEFSAIHPGRYRVKTSFWSFQWNKGQVLPARGTEAARLSVVRFNENGRGGGHPSWVLGYFDAPSLKPQVHEFVQWFNPKESLGFNTASLAPVANYSRPGRAMAFVGPGIANDWLDIEGPLHDIWPPLGHRLLFGDLPLVEFDPAKNPGVRPPRRKVLKQEVIHAKNKPEPAPGIWTVRSENPTADADRLLANFLPKAFRRPVSDATRREYLHWFETRVAAGDCFETALRSAYRAALCSPDFLHHVEGIAPQDGVNKSVDDLALACRLSYFLRNSQPDERLSQLAAAGKLRTPEVLRGEVERLLNDPGAERFVEDFLGQWLKLRQIAANDPDRKLYPEFSPYLQDSMVAETRAYFRELLARDLGADRLIRSDFAMLNEKLAVHYGIEGVTGSQIRRVALPADSPRGPFLTQAALLKITANGTTTSPVPRGAFVLARLLGEEPDPPPANVPAIEPDVRGAKTIREQLDKHRADASCAGCHAKLDPPGFALEAFDVIGGRRDRYRSLGEGPPAPRGSIDPFIGIGFKLGPAVDASGKLPDGRAFADVREFQTLLLADQPKLLRNMARQFAVYALGRPLSFGDRDRLEAIVAATQRQGGGLRTLIHELTQSELFRLK